MTPEQFVDKFKLIELKKSIIKSIRVEREAEEESIAAEYKVDECNKKRADSSIKFQSQIDAIQSEIDSLEQELKLSANE